MSKTNNGSETITLHFGPTVALEPSVSARAFALVDPKAWGRADWKEEISAVFHPNDLKAANVTVAQICAAIAFYTATEAQVREVAINAEPGVMAIVVKAPGYRRGPAH